MLVFWTFRVFGYNQLNLVLKDDFDLFSFGRWLGGRASVCAALPTVSNSDQTVTGTLQ